MKVKLILGLAAVALAVTIYARGVRLWSEAELRKASDLIVVGRPILVEDLDEGNSLGFSKNFRGVETTFKVSTVVKGTVEGGQVVLHHYVETIGSHREGVELTSVPNGPILMNFTSGATNEYALYLVKDGPNRYAPVAGQIDANTSIRRTAVAYTITNLGTLGGRSSSARAINASGQVVGASTTAKGQTHAFLYSGEKMRDFGALPGGDYSGANAINGSGQIAGWSGTGDGQRRAFVFSAGQMREIGTLGGKTSEAYAINSAGDIAGQAETADGQKHAFFCVAGRMPDLGTFDGTSSIARGLNDSGQIVGNYVSVRPSPTEPVLSIREIPFVIDGGKMTAIDTSGHQKSESTAITSTGQIIGSIGDITQWSSDHAFFYNEGKVQDLGTLGGNAPFSQANAVNSHWQIVGSSGIHPLDNKTPGEVAFIYAYGRMLDLGKQVGEARLAAAGFKALVSAAGINDQGQIVGTGIGFNGDETAFLLTPIHN